MIDVVTVYHNAKNRQQAYRLARRLDQVEPGRTNVYLHSNMEENLGFAKGCNIAAAGGESEIIAFLNPDVEINGPFIDAVEATLVDNVVVTGCRFGKPQYELTSWGVTDWVCGATFFVLRSWFEELNGFDERFEWSFEETDFVRRSELLKKQVKSIDLPLSHSSPTDDSVTDMNYKFVKFREAQQAYQTKWSS